MIKYVILTVIFSCATTADRHKHNKEEIIEQAVCKNTLQRDIHRNECQR